MAHFAQIDENGIVQQVLVVDDRHADRGQDFLAIDCGLSGVWVQTSYNTVGGEHLFGGTPMRKNFAGVGMTYDENRDAFYDPQPHASWSLNEESCIWEAPVARPDDGKLYNWDEDSLSWIEIPTE
jgi:hypothetical protein